MATAVRRALAAAGIAVVTMVAAAPISTAAATPSVTAASVASVQPINGQTVGVAHPIIVTFTRPVTDRPAAEQTIKVTSPTEMTGRFEWRVTADGPRQFSRWRDWAPSDRFRVAMRARMAAAAGTGAGAGPAGAANARDA